MLHVIPVTNTPNSYHGYNITYTSLLFFFGFSWHAAPGNDMLHLYPVTNTRNGYHGYN